jgi:hypothetical protein
MQDSFPGFGKVWQRRIAAVGVFTNQKMGDVFSFLDSFYDINI